MRKSAKTDESEEKIKTRRSQKDVVECRTCKNAQLICWEISNQKDPLIAKCTIKQYNNYEVACCARHCPYYDFDRRWKEKTIERRMKSTGWSGKCSVND